MTDRKQQIVEVALAILREEGLRGFTQPRIAARAGLRQSHLTYYFPTRTDLLTATAEAAVNMQLAAAAAMIASIESTAQATESVAEFSTRHETTRVLVSLAQAADEEPAVRVLFNKLVDGVGGQIRAMFERLGLAPERAHVDLLHALAVGLAVVDLATSRSNGKVRSRNAVAAILPLLDSTKEPAEAPRKRPRRVP